MVTAVTNSKTAFNTAENLEIIVTIKKCSNGDKKVQNLYNRIKNKRSTVTKFFLVFDDTPTVSLRK